jgi:hypothetical protein
LQDDEGSDGIEYTASLSERVVEELANGLIDRTCENFSRITLDNR